MPSGPQIRYWPHGCHGDSIPVCFSAHCQDIKDSVWQTFTNRKHRQWIQCFNRTAQTNPMIGVDMVCIAEFGGLKLKSKAELKNAAF